MLFRKSVPKNKSSSYLEGNGTNQEQKTNT